MKILDHTLSGPQDNLTLEEHLLDEAEEGREGEVLRFWESSSYFAVLGISNKPEIEADTAVCKQDGIAILKRVSGGGTVLQGPGCLNYALILKIPSSGPLTNLVKTNACILERHRAVLAPLLPGKVAVQGISDLTWNGLKFSGNAQRRKKNFLLFHGTFLHAFDLSKISRYLKMPSKMPDYRSGKPHQDFVGNVPLSAEQIKAAVASVWDSRKE